MTLALIRVKIQKRRTMYLQGLGVLSLERKNRLRNLKARWVLLLFIQDPGGEADGS